MAHVNQVKRAAIESVTLTLDKNELGLLCTVLNRIGGTFDTSPRKYAQQIIDALKAQGAFLVDPNIRDAIDDKIGRGSIYFLDDTI